MWLLSRSVIGAAREEGEEHLAVLVDDVLVAHDDLLQDVRLVHIVST